MKKKNRWLLMMLPVLLCVIATVLYAVVFVWNDDVTAPKITIDSEVLEVSVHASDEDLLHGVAAFDEEDGDVTTSILIEAIGTMDENNETTITYAAFDAAGNVSKTSRKLKYTDYESPVFGLNGSLFIKNNSTTDVLRFVTAQDVVDGDISRRVKGTLISNTGSLSNAGVHQVEFRVTNSLGDTQRMVLPVEVYANNTYNATLNLGEEYLIYIRRGAAFKPEEYLNKLIVGTTEYSLKNQNPPIENLTKEQVQALGDDRELEVRTYINSFVDPDENIDPYVGIANVEIENGVVSTIPGIYSVIYTVNYEDRYMAYARLNVVVEE